MIKVKIFIFLLIIASQAIGQVCPPDQPGPQDGCHGCGGGTIALVDSLTGTIYIIPVLHAFDPNDIIGPIGYSDKKWISPSLTLDYTIRFENDPDFATGPAQIVRINHPLDSNININSLRLSDFGFGHFVFKVPKNSAFYQQTLDVTDSLGVLVNVTAGIDVTKREAFWIFESLDPETGLPPENALRGFLPVNDTTINRFNDTIPKAGEGFVSFSVQAQRNITQVDSIRAQAFIVFDVNEPIETNIWVNNLDPVPPTSRVSAIENTGNYMYRIQTTAEDGQGSGVESYDLYYSVNGGRLLPLATNLQTDSTYIFDKGIKDSTYCFVTIARDHAGNTETFKSLGENCVTVSEHPVPVILDFSPKSGPAGTEVTIRGKHFTGVSKVVFNELTASYTSVNDSTLKATAPENGSTGFIRVTGPGGIAASDTVYTYGGATGIESPTAVRINLFPNPTSGQFTISTTQSAFPKGILYIRDMLGKTIKVIDLSKVNSPELVIDISFAPSGIYFVYLENKREKWVQRILKR
jgi:hypothetical protein